MALPLRTVALTLLLLLGGGAVAEDAGADWLQRMAIAFGDLDYQGTFAYYHGDSLDTLELTHNRRNGESWERLIHLNGPVREIVRRGEELACILTREDEMYELSGSIPAGPFAGRYARGFDSLPPSYCVEVLGSGRSAGRSAVRLAIKPVDDNRYGYRLWLDESTALMLRSELVTADGQLLEVFQFTNLRIGSGVETVEVREARGDEILHRLTMLARPARRPDSAPEDDMGWQPEWLPAGFEMAVSDIRRTGDDRMPLASLIYSDGLASISVFVEMLGQMDIQASPAPMRNGATVAVSRLARGRDDMSYLVTVVGEVPYATASRVLDSVTQAAP